MEAIRELQRQLAKAQEASNVKKISERNCIDLVQKLIELEQVKLMHTSTGKEWLTPEQLDREIREVLASTGGRLGVTDLPTEVGVAIEHIEVRVDSMCKKDGSLVRLQGELLSGQFVQGVAQEVEESLAESGCLAVSDIAVRYNLPADYVRASVLNKITTPHTTKQNSIYTDAHAARVGARTRGALRGCTLPVTLAQLAARHRLDADLLATAVQKMIKDGTLHGKLSGSTFTPKVFADAQGGKVDDFYASNKYLPLSMAKSNGIVVKDWAKEKKFEGVTLSTAFVDNQLVEPVMASITEALAADSWTDVAALLPPALVAADARELLTHLKKKLPAGAVVLDHVAMSKKFIQSLAGKFEAEAKVAAERLLSAPVGKASAKKAQPAADEDDDDGGSKKKGKKGVKGKKGRGDDDDDDGPACTATASAESGVDNQKVLDLIADDFPEMPADVHAELSGLVQPLLAAMVAEAQTALQATLQNKRKEQFEGSEKFVQEQYEKVLFGFKALEAKDLLSSPLHQHLLREAVTEPLHRLLSLRWHELSGSVLEVTAANRRECLDKIIAKEGAAKAEPLSRLLAVFSGGKKDVKEPAKGEREGAKKRHETTEKDFKKPKKGKKGKGDSDSEDEEVAAAPETLDAIYHAAASDCHIYCKKIDKKREKEVLQNAVAACKEKLKESSEAAKALDALKEVRELEGFQQLAREERQVCVLPLQLALLQDGVPGMLFPAEPWAMKLVARSLTEEAVRDEALLFCAAVEKEAAPEK